MYDCLKENGLTGYKYKLRDIAVVEVLFATGARVYEISNIREDSVNLNSVRLELWERVEKKDTSRSVIPQYLQFKKILYGE